MIEFNNSLLLRISFHLCWFGASFGFLGVFILSLLLVKPQSLDPTWALCGPRAVSLVLCGARPYR